MSYIGQSYIGSADINGHVEDTNNPHGVTKAQVGLGNVEDLKVNLTAVIAPGAADDSTAGYAVGSRWFNIAADEEWVCLDSTPNSAIWLLTTADIAEINTHIADTSIHFTQASISITESQISDLQSYSLDTHNHTLDSLANVTITANSVGEILKWNGTAWINNTLPEANIAPAAELFAHTGDGTIHFTQAAISITESQISDLGPYVTASGGGLDSTQFLRSDTDDSFDGTLTSTITAGTIFLFDGGDSRVTVHDGTGNLNIKAGVDTQDRYVATGSGGAKIALNYESGAGSIDFRTAPIGTVGAIPAWQTMTYDATGNLTIPGDITVAGKPLNKRIQDTVGSMVSGNTESGISVVYQDTDGTLDFTVAASTPVRTLVHRANPYGPITTDTTVTYSFDTADYDESGVWTANNLFTIPTGYTRFKFSSSIFWYSFNGTNVGAYTKLFLVKNVWVTYYGYAESIEHVSQSQFVSQYIETPWLDVVPGDYFRVFIWHNTGSTETLLTSPGNWAAVELLP